MTKIIKTIAIIINILWIGFFAYQIIKEGLPNIDDFAELSVFLIIFSMPIINFIALTYNKK